MRFSYTLIKKLVPLVKNKKQLIDLLNEHSFEVVDADGDSFEVSLPPNRFSDAASHWGIAREISAILGGNFVFPRFNAINTAKSAGNFSEVEIKDKKLCRRYAALSFKNIKIQPSSKWIQKILKDCGLRPINNVVDIMNYVMLETGQPLHAFDADKLTGGIFVRRAKNNESIETLDNAAFKLNSDVLVIADKKFPLAIAGIKGGKKAEVNQGTKNIIVEAANFDGPNIYKTSKLLNLKTDASLRFSHGLSPALVGLGLSRAKELLEKEVAARLEAFYDSRPDKPIKKIIEFDVEKFNRLIGINLNERQAVDYLKRLGFAVSKSKSYKLKAKSSFLVEVPLIRQDIENFEDLAEEVCRLYGYNKIKPTAPEVAIKIAEVEDVIAFNDQLRSIMTGFGTSEVFNYSFVSKNEALSGDLPVRQAGLPADRQVFGGKAVELLNPVSSEYEFLRLNLANGLLKNIKDNLRFFGEARIFEIGKVFKNNGSVSEGWRLGIAIGSKNKETFFELKGLVSELLKKAGLVDFFMRDSGKKPGFLQNDGALMIKSDNLIIGYLGKAIESAGVHVSVCELDLNKLLELVEGELEFRPLPKYPSVMRDISVLVSRDIRIGEVLEAMNSPEIKYIDDVDLIDEYFSDKLGGSRQSLTFRIVFRSDEKTLEDKEADKELGKIARILKEKFGAEIR